MLDLDPVVPWAVLAKKSKSGLLLTEANKLGLKIPVRADRSLPSILVGLCVKGWATKLLACSDCDREFDTDDPPNPGELKSLGELLSDVVRCGGPGSLPNVGNSNEKLTSFGLLIALRPLPVRYDGTLLLPSDVLRVPMSEKRLRYSDSSVDIFSI